MQLIGVLFIIVGIIDFGVSWIGIDLTSQFVDTSLSQYTPIIFGITGGILYSIGGKGGEKELINSESHNINTEDNTSLTSNQNNDLEGVIESHSLESIQMVLDSYIKLNSKSRDKNSTFFTYTLNEEKGIYVQGIMDGENYRLEISYQKYADYISNQGVKNLVSLGWDLPNEEENLNKYFTLKEIINGTASKLIYASFKIYDLGPGDDKKVKFMLHDPTGHEIDKSNTNYSFNEIEDKLNSDTEISYDKTP